MSTVEREILQAILKLTNHGPIDRTLIAKSTNFPLDVTELLLKKFEKNELLNLNDRIIEISSTKRIKIAIAALKLGADFEYVSQYLKWDEFESFSMQLLEIHNYRVLKNLRFKEGKKRWEIDLLACKKPVILSVDCKHWKSNWSRGAITRMVEEHIRRTRSFARILPEIRYKLRLEKGTQFKIIPIILSLRSYPSKMHHNSPIVSIFQLQNFLSDLPIHIESLTYFPK
jgi:Holliday junction resolvase-like predicted endonuclease